MAQVLFFYVKYLVLFGVPALLMRLDGLTPPPLPRCVSTMFSFTGMWRSVAWFVKALQGCPVGGPMVWPASKGWGHHPFSALYSSRIWHFSFFICLTGSISGAADVRMNETLNNSKKLTARSVWEYISNSAVLWKMEDTI